MDSVLLGDGWECCTIPLWLLTGEVGLNEGLWVGVTPWEVGLPETEACLEFSRAIRWATSLVSPGAWVKFPTKVSPFSFLTGASATGLVVATWLLLELVGWRWLMLPTKVRVSSLSRGAEVGAWTIPLYACWATARGSLDSLQNLPTNIKNINQSSNY